MVILMGFRNKASITSKLLYRCMRRWRKHGHANTAASLAFYSLISLVPILVCGIWIASWLVGERIAKESVLDGANSIAGKTIADSFSQLLNSEMSWFGSGISPFIGALFLLYSATKVIAELRKSLGGIFGAPQHKGKRAMLATAMNRGIGVILLLFLGGFISCAVVVETVLLLVIASAEDHPLLLTLMTYSAPLITFIAIVILSTTAMRWLPPSPPTFRNAIQGGIVSAVLLLFLKLALTTFLNYAEVGSYYGSSITLVLVLFYIYFAMQVFLFGAEYAAELAREQRKQDVEDELSEETEVTPSEDIKGATESDIKPV